MGSIASLDGGYLGNDDADSLAECMHLEASLGAWPRPRSAKDAQLSSKYHAFLGGAHLTQFPETSYCR